MLLYRLWNYLKGYVIIYIENISHERIINLFKRKNITIWDVKRKNKGIQLVIESKSYNKEKELIINTGAIVIKKCGFTYEGTLRDYFYLGNQYVSRLYYSMLEHEWESKK